MHYKCFMHYRLVCLIISVMNADRIGLGITHEVFIFTRHMFMHSSCIHSFSSFLFWTSVVFLFSLSLSLSLSLSHRTPLWNQNRRNPLWLGTLIMVPSHPLLLFLLFHLISGSVMKRPRRTSLRTSRNVAFIRNAQLFYRILPTLLSLKSFKLGIGNLYLRNPRGVPSCLFKSFTPTYTASKPLYLSLLLHLEVHIS